MSGLTIADRLKWIAESVRLHGPRAIWWEIKARISPAARARQHRIAREGRGFDEEFGYRTDEVVGLDDLHVMGAREGARHYQPMPVAELNALLKAVDVAFETATFVDLGSGMGRVVLIAADLPFRRVIGVEFARELHETACVNLHRRETLKGSDPRIEFVHGDAGALAIPDGPAIFFLYNPFGPPTLTRVLENVSASWRASPREIRLLCYNVAHHAEIAAAGFVRRDVDGLLASTIYSLD
jgi:SAM-dependent methyltransferase